jgi:two-component system, OmpR family, response regulator AdeR
MAKLLLIEDDIYVQRMYQRMFGHESFDLIFASNGLEGLEHAQKLKPNLILLDILLPGLSGLEVLERLKAEGDTRDIPIFILSNLADEATIEAAKKLGAEEYIVKADFSPEQVVEEVKKYISATS